MARSRPPLSALIQSKVNAPPVPPRAVERPRVTRLLQALIADFRVVAVCATPGAGKTTATLQATAAVGRPIAWLTVDETDRAPGRLITYLEAAIERKAPDASGVATSALASRIPHGEAAGLLAEAIGDVPIVVVLDQLERLEGAADPENVIAAFLRYLPASARAVLLSRRSIDPLFGSSMEPGSIASIGESDLAFTVEEAGLALANIDGSAVDADAAVEATGGWVTGVLFEAWRSTEHVFGVGGEGDPLSGYLSSQILAGVPDADRDFLVTTSLLDSVTTSRARALGIVDPAARLASLRARHLPATWDPGGRAMRCHPRFREYLLDRLRDRRDHDVASLRGAYARLLASEGHLEEATEEYLSVGRFDDASRTAPEVIEHVIDRLDFPVAERWLAALVPVTPASEGRLAEAELMLAIGQMDFVRAAAVGDRLDAAGEQETVARRSPRVASLLAWTYWHVGRVREAKALISVAEKKPATDGMRYFFTLVDNDHPEWLFAPNPTGGPTDALVLRVHFAHGYLRLLQDQPASRWVQLVTAPWRMSALRALGHTEEAARLLENGLVAQPGPLTLNAVEVMIDLDRRDEASRYLALSREHIQASGSVLLDMYATVLEAKMHLRLDADSGAAKQLITQLEERTPLREYRWIAEAADTWIGLALLWEEDAAGARQRLQDAVDSMQAGDRILELPTAGVYLAEACWRLGDEDAADQAADIALAAAHRQGSNHIVIQALVDFPEVATRRMDSQQDRGSEWHEIGRALLKQGVNLGREVGDVVHLFDLGRAELSVDGRDVRPKIKKALELLALLISTPDHSVARSDIVTALFESRSDRSAQSYLRQAVHRLREVLPASVALEVDTRGVSLSGVLDVTSDSQRFQGLLAEASHQLGDDRLATICRALELSDKGTFLPGASSPWASERRQEIDDLALDARFDAAELAYAHGRYADAEQFVGAVLHADPYRERAWRLLMLIANQLGDEDGLISAFRRCSAALAELGLEPSPATREIIEQARA